MIGSESTKPDVGVQSFRLTKTNDGAPHPFEIVEGGDGLPVTITTLDEKSGAVLGQVRTFEPQQLGEGARIL